MTSLKAAIADELEKVGAVRKPGSANEWILPSAKGGVASTTVNLDPQPTAQKEEPVTQGAVAADQLRLFVERIERLEEEKKGTADDIRDVYAEAKANGYDAKIIRIMVRLRKMETHTRQEQVALVETYANALGLQGVLPL